MRFALFLLALPLAFTACATNPGSFPRCGAEDTCSTPRLAHLEKVVASDGANSDNLSERAFALAMLGRPRAARAAFTEALASAKGSAERRRVLDSAGWAELNLGNPRAALARWKEAAKIEDSPHWWRHHTLAVGYWAVGRKQEALAEYDLAAKAHPEFFATWKNLVAYTGFWTWKEKQTIYPLYDAWSRGYAVPAK